MTDNGSYEKQLSYTAETNKNRERYLKDCIANYRAKKYNEALAICNLTIQIDQYCFQIYHIKALALIGLGFYEEAVIACEQACQLDAQKADVYVDKGVALYQLGYYNKALIACEKAIQINTNHSRAYHGKALNHFSLNQFEEAISNCAQAIRIDPTRAKIYITMAEALCQLRRYTEASLAYKQAISLNNNYYELYIAKGQSLVEQGDKLFVLEHYEEAVFEYEQALLFCPNDELKKKIPFCKGKVLIERGDNLFSLKRYAEAGDLYRQAIMFDLNNKDIYVCKGKELQKDLNLFLGLKQYENALDSIERAYEFGWKQGDLLASKANILFDQEFYEEAGSTYREAIKLDFRIENEYNSRAKSLFDDSQKCLELKRYNDAINGFIKTIQFGYKLTDCYLYLSTAILKKGQRFFELKFFKDALFLYRSASSIYKDVLFETDREVSDRYKSLFYHIGNSSTEARFIGKGKEGDILILIGEVLIELERYEEAKISYKEAANILGIETGLQLLKNAEYLFSMGSYEKSRKAYIQAMLFNPIFKDNYKDKGRDLLEKSLDLYEAGLYAEAYSAYKVAIQFDHFNKKVSFVRGRAINTLAHLKQLQSSREENKGKEAVKILDEVDTAVDYNKLMLEGYDGKRKVALVEGVSDPDEYDDNYNQYYELYEAEDE